MLLISSGARALGQFCLKIKQEPSPSSHPCSGSRPGERRRSVCGRQTPQFQPSRALSLHHHPKLLTPPPPQSLQDRLFPHLAVPKHHWVPVSPFWPRITRIPTPWMPLASHPHRGARHHPPLSWGHPAAWGCWGGYGVFAELHQTEGEEKGNKKRESTS